MLVLTVKIALLRQDRRLFTYRYRLVHRWVAEMLLNVQSDSSTPSAGCAAGGVGWYIILSYINKGYR